MFQENERIRLRWNPNWTGKVVKPGPEQSVVRFDNSGFRIIINEQLVPEAPIGRAWMAGKRLEHWPTLPRPELKRRIELEKARKDLTEEEQQLLDAALERLLSWEEPRTTSRSKEIIMDTEKEESLPESTASPAADQTKESATVPKRKTKAAAGKKKKAAAPPPKKKVVAKAKANGAGNGRSRIPADAKIFKTNKENPYREGTGAYERTEIVFKSSGQTAATIAKKVLPTTLNNLKKLGLIRIEG
jgi:hypothetical protein